VPRASGAGATLHAAVAVSPGRHRPPPPPPPLWNVCDAAAENTTPWLTEADEVNVFCEGRLVNLGYMFEVPLPEELSDPKCMTVPKHVVARHAEEAAAGVGVSGGGVGDEDVLKHLPAPLVFLLHSQTRQYYIGMDAHVFKQVSGHAAAGQGGA